MSGFGHYNPRTRYIARDRQRTQITIAALMVLAAVGTTAFWLGRQHAAYQINSLSAQVKERETEIKNLESDLTKMRAETQTATLRFDQLQEQMNKDLPDGAVRDLVALLRQQLQDGMSPERLAFLLRSARPPQNCSDPATRRFVPKTPAYTGSNSVASFGEGAVKITGTGTSARNKDGKEEAWFDPAQPVTVTYTSADGQTETKTGQLPMQHAMIAAGREYRFTLSEGEKSFIRVTFDSCDYP
jgi:outer membrane murein-binding lipoprotein Lpp